MKRELRCLAYVRHVDDALLFSDSRSELWAWKEAAERWLARIRMTTHRGAHPKPVTEGIPFLGFVVFPRQRRLKRRRVLYCWRKFRRLLVDYQNGDLLLAAVMASVQGWLNHARFGNTIGLRRDVLTRHRIVPPQRFPLQYVL